jgi:uncharacterized protein YbjQ (UPF0145 family)
MKADMKVTSAYTIPGVEIIEHLLIVHGEALMNADDFTNQSGFFHHLTGTTDVPDGSDGFSAHRWKAYERLKERAAWHNADGIIGTTFSYVAIGATHILISVSGTAVKFRRLDKLAADSPTSKTETAAPAS